VINRQSSATPNGSLLPYIKVNPLMKEALTSPTETPAPDHSYAARAE